MIDAMSSETKQLPLWPTDLRGFPNALGRSALFGIAHARAGDRVYLRDKRIAALAGIAIDYTGEELRQDDQDVFLQVLHMARAHPLGTEVMFVAHAMLRELQWQPTSTSYARLVACLKRLKATGLAITVKGHDTHNFTGSLIRLFRWLERDNETPLREWQVVLEPEIIALFDPTAYSRLNWAIRCQLAPMAKWLHTFYNTHEKPYPYSTAKLRELMDSKCRHLFQFRFKLRGALQQLVDCGFLEEAIIDSKSDLVLVRRSSKLWTSAPP